MKIEFSLAELLNILFEGLIVLVSVYFGAVLAQRQMNRQNRKEDEEKRENRTLIPLLNTIRDLSLSKRDDFSGCMSSSLSKFLAIEHMKDLGEIKDQFLDFFELLSRCEYEYYLSMINRADTVDVNNMRNASQEIDANQAINRYHEVICHQLDVFQAKLREKIYG